MKIHSIREICEIKISDKRATPPCGTSAYPLCTSSMRLSEAFLKCIAHMKSVHEMLERAVSHSEYNRSLASSGKEQ